MNREGIHERDRLPTRLVMYVVIAVSSLASMLLAPRTVGDWPFFTQMSKAFSGVSGLHVYGDHPNIQSGPVTLIVFRFLSFGPFDSFALNAPIYALLGCITAATLLEVRRELRPASSRAVDITSAVGCVALMAWWTYLKAYGHLDDALTLTCGSLAVLLVARKQRSSAALLLGICLAIKPWSIFMLPLTIGKVGPLRQRLAGPLIGGGVGVLLWSPFLVTDLRTLRGFQPTVRLAYDSVLRLFSVTQADIPSWIRLMQLVLALTLATFAAARGRLGGALLVGFAARLVLDAGTWNYYSTGFVLGAFAWDLLDSRWRLPWATVLASILLAPVWVTENMVLRQWMRLIACVLAVAIVYWSAASRPPEVEQPTLMDEIDEDLSSALIRVP